MRRGVSVGLVLIIAGTVLLIVPQLVYSILPRLVYSLSNLTTMVIEPLSDFRLPLQVSNPGMLVVAVNYTRMPQVLLNGAGGIRGPEVMFSQGLFSLVVFSMDAPGNYYLLFRNNNSIPMIIRYSVAMLSSSELNNLFIALAISFAGFILLIGGVVLLLIIAVVALRSRLGRGSS